MRRRRLGLGVVLGVATLALAAALPAAAGATVRLQGIDASAYPTIRASVVTSKASSTPPVLTENGNRVVGLEATNLAQDKSVVVAIDRSRSMLGKPLADATAAARTFVQGKPGSDRVAIVAFGHRAITLTGFSTSTIDSAAALGTLSVDPKQGTALYDAVVLAAHQLAGEPNASRVLVLLTDGTDVSSEASLDSAIKTARQSGVTVYPIGIEGTSFSPDALKTLAAATGGSYHRAASTATLPAVYADIARELARTWRVEYVTAARPGDALRLGASVKGLGRATSSLSLPGSADSGGAAVLPAFLTGNAIGTLALALLVGLLVLGAAFSVMASREGSWVKNRLQPHLAAPAAKRKAAPRERLQGLRRLTHATDAAFAGAKQWKSLRRLLERANLPLKPAEFTYLAGAVGIGLGLLVAVTGASPLVILASMVVGGALPFAYAWFRASRRLKAFENQLPDLLITIAASLKAGHSFRQGIQTVVDEGQPPASEEFKRVLTETRLGRPMDDALAEMGDRVGSKNLDFVITAVTIQRQVGGSLATLFDMVADAVRQRQQFQRKIKGLTAMGRMSAYVLIGLPFFVAFVLTMLNSTYMSPLWNTSTGHKLIAIGLTMMVIGSAVLKKMVTFKG